MASAFVPPIFVSHTTPALALDSDKGEDFVWWARDLPRPRGILVVSAHWQEAKPTRGSTASRPPLLHDYVGHDDARAVRYAAPGAPELAYDLASLVPIERSERGWDHGVWTPLVHLHPNADVPVLELSLVLGATPRALYALGRRIGRLCEAGYLVVGSGGITNPAPGDLAAEANAETPAWARELDAWVANVLADSEMERLLAWRTEAPHARRAHPTSEHIAPLFVAAGAASLYGHAVGFPVRGFEHGSLSRRCIQFGTTSTS